MSEEIKLDIGACLKARREELGVSLSDAAQRTRIRKSYLESLEDNQFSNLPGKAYVKGFIRVYAEYLNLETPPFLKELESLQAEASEEAPAKVYISAQPQKKSSKKKRSSGGLGAFVVGFVVVLIAGGVVYSLISKPEAEPESQMENVSAPVQESVVKEETAPQVSEVDKAPDSVQEAETVAEPVVEAEVAVEEAVEPIPQTLKLIKAEGSSLRMLALSQGSLIIYVDKRKPHEYALYEGLDLTWKVREQVSIEMDAAGLAGFWLDGKELEVAESKSFQLIQTP